MLTIIFIKIFFADGIMLVGIAGIQLVAAMCNGKLIGGSIGSTEIQFTPGKIQAGQYVADTKTAGLV